MKENCAELKKKKQQTKKKKQIKMKIAPKNELPRSCRLQQILFLASPTNEIAHCSEIILDKKNHNNKRKKIQQKTTQHGF